MDKDEKFALLSLPVILLLAYLVAWAGSYASYYYEGIPIIFLCFAVAFLIQWLAFIPAYIFQSEKFYDLTGSFTFLMLLLIAGYFTGTLDIRAVLVTFCILFWSVRLGFFLFIRILKAGEDKRFRELKKSPARFLMAWTLQGMWVNISLAPSLVIITSLKKVPFDFFALTGLLLWSLGFTVEVIADWQKSKFRKNKLNQGHFIQSGLWAWSRHPNYLGEIILWLGLSLISIPVLEGWQWVTLISPLFIIVLLTKISGIPLLEEAAA